MASRTLLLSGPVLLLSLLLAPGLGCPTAGGDDDDTTVGDDDDTTVGDDDDTQGDDDDSAPITTVRGTIQIIGDEPELGGVTVSEATAPSNSMVTDETGTWTLDPTVEGAVLVRATRSDLTPGLLLISLDWEEAKGQNLVQFTLFETAAYDQYGSEFAGAVDLTEGSLMVGVSSATTKAAVTGATVTLSESYDAAVALGEDSELGTVTLSDGVIWFVNVPVGEVNLTVSDPSGASCPGPALTPTIEAGSVTTVVHRCP